MLHFHRFISSLQQNITQNKLTAIVEDSKLIQQILYILQINGYIEGFQFSDVDHSKIIIYFKFKNNGNVIKKIYKFKNSKRYRFNCKFLYKAVGLNNFTIILTRQGLITNNEALLLQITGIPLLGIL